MYIAVQDLGLEQMWVVFPGERRLTLAERISTLPVAAMEEAVAAMA